MSRRAFLAGGLVVALGAPPAARAQPGGKVPRIGFFGPPPDVGGGLVQAFQQGLRDLGYIEGQNITIEYRWTNVDPPQLAVLAAELVRLRVDVLVASVTPVILAARRATTTIPIVMANAADPVASGLIVSLARPGGNVTGVSRLVPEVVGKELELLVRTISGTARIGVLVNPDNPLHPEMVNRVRREAPSLGVELETGDATAPNQFEAVVERLAGKRVGAVLVLGDGMFFLNRAQLAHVLLRNRLPSMFGNTEHVEAGGLMSYAASSRDNYRRAAYFVDRILKGAQPADLPVEQPTKFEFAVNLKTAKALGLTLPSSLLLQVDRVIE